MGLRRWALACACAGLLGTSPLAAAEPRLGKLVAYELDGYHLYTTRSANQAKQFASQLAKFHVTLEKLMGKAGKDTRTPTRIVILSRGEWERYLQPRKNIAGWFHSRAFANFIVMNGDAESSDALHLVFHEYTHYYLASQFSGEYPPWLNEGLAEVMGYSKFEQDSAILMIPMERLYQARDGNWIPFERLIRVDRNSPEYVSHKMAGSFYAQSWLTVHYGLLENRAFGKKMFGYVDELNRLVPQETAAKNQFGDLAAIDADLRAYSRSNKLHSGGLALGSVPEVVLPPGRTVAELDALAIIADLMIDTRLAPDRIRPVVQSLMRRQPDSARAAILAARIELLAQDPGAFAAAVKHAESLLKESDWENRRELASVLMENALAFQSGSRPDADDKHDLERAMRWFGEAVGHDDANVEALWGYGYAATLLGRDLDLAERSLLAAYSKSPTNPQIAVALANLKVRQQKPDEMIPYLKDCVRYARDLSLRRWAATTLVETQQFIAERDRIDADNRQQREQYEKMRAEYEKKFGPQKRKPGKG